MVVERERVKLCDRVRRRLSLAFFLAEQFVNLVLRLIIQRFASVLCSAGKDEKHEPGGHPSTPAACTPTGAPWPARSTASRAA